MHDIPNSAKVDSTLVKGLSVLETLLMAPDSVGVSELSRSLGLTKSNTHRLLRTLTACGYVRQEAGSRRYQPTMHTWKLGQTMMQNLGLAALCRPALHALSAETGEAIYLSVREGLSTLYLDKIDSRQPVRAFTPNGGTAPLYCVATGKALLAFDYQILREQIVNELRPYTDRTITNVDNLDREMARIAASNIAVARGEYRENVFSIASAIFDPSGKALAAIAVSAPELNLRPGDVEAIAGSVRTFANGITDAIAAR